MSLEIKVPDIGDFKDVPVIEIHVKEGDTVAAEDSLVTLESDKATLDVPAPQAGVIRAVKVALGDKVSEGSVIVLLEAATTEASQTSEPLAATPAPPPIAAALSPSAHAGIPAVTDTATAASASRYTGPIDGETELLVLGAGPGGYSAAFRAADLGLKTLLVERYATLGGVCLNVGCIPSKALLHVAAIIEESQHIHEAGVRFAAPKIDLDGLRQHKEKIVGKLTGGLSGMAKGRKVEVLRGYGYFLDAHHLCVEETHGSGQDKTNSKKVIRFQQCIIAAGSAAVHLPFLPDDSRIVDSTGALALPKIPGTLLVIGGGIIGLEMATVYSTLGAQVDVVELLEGLMQGPDRDLVRIWEKQNAHRFEAIMCSTRVSKVVAQEDGLWVSFEGEHAPEEAQRYDMILQAAGRTPNGKKIAAEAAGVAVDAHGFIAVDSQMRTNVAHIFAIGDIVGQPMLAHKAVHEAHVAAEAAAGQKSHFDARVIPGVAYTHPEVAWAGMGEDAAKKAGCEVHVARFPWAASGRAIANAAEYGMTKLIFDARTERIIGGGMVGPGAGDMVGEIALAIEMGCDATDIGKTIHPHPTLGETIGLAAEVAHGSCTDLPPMRPRKA